MQPVAQTQSALKNLAGLEVELPTWGFANSGTRFRVFPEPGSPRSTEEKLEDAATVHRYTGCAPKVSLHVPWDRDPDYGAMRQTLAANGMRVGAINSNTFQEEDYRLGSLAHPDLGVRRRALEHILECCEIGDAVGAGALKLWLGDGTNYPGQDDFRLRKQRLEEAVSEIHAFLPSSMRLLIEYKLYEPAFYHTDIQDWGMALLLCQKAGEHAKVVVDLGHHAHGVNIEQIVAVLLDEGRLGGFDLNDRKYGDDDLIAGSVNPYQLFLIFNELVAAGLGSGLGAETARAAGYMVDQSHNIEPKIPAMIRTVMTLQEQWLKASLVDREALRASQDSGDILAANGVLKDAYDTDVRPALAGWREARGLPADPLRGYLASGEAEARVDARKGGDAAGWN